MGEDQVAPPSSVRTFDPPRPVWIKLRELLKIGGFDDTSGDPELGLRIESEVPGMAKEMIPRSDTGGLVLVSYPIWTGNGQHQTSVTHYVPLHLVRRRSRRRGQREDDGDGRRRYG